MTTDEIISKVNEAYRKGYLDGMTDRKPVENPAFVLPETELEPDKIAWALNNILSYNGEIQKDFEMSRTGGA